MAKVSEGVKVYMSEEDFKNLYSAGALLKEVNDAYDSKLTILSTQNVLVDEQGVISQQGNSYCLRDASEELLTCEDSIGLLLYLKGYKRAMDKAAEAMNNAFNLDGLDEEEIEETSVETETVEVEISAPEVEEEEKSVSESDNTDSEIE